MDKGNVGIGLGFYVVLGNGITATPGIIFSSSYKCIESSTDFLHLTVFWEMGGVSTHAYIRS